MLGLTMRSYKEVVQQFADAYGLEKSTTCEHFVQASREKLKQLMERSLVGTSIAVMLIGTIFKGQIWWWLSVSTRRDTIAADRGSFCRPP
jgi:hypothetical protein